MFSASAHAPTYHATHAGSASFDGSSLIDHHPPIVRLSNGCMRHVLADGALASGFGNDPAFGHDGWNSYTIFDPDDVGQAGDYHRMHAIGNDPSDGSMLILGRTFFEDNSTGHDYVSLVRARFDLIFEEQFE